MLLLEVDIHVFASDDPATVRNKICDYCSNDLITAKGIVEDIMTPL